MTKPVQKILWGEGLFIRPQHFQQQDAFHQWRLQQAMRFMHPYACGIHKLTLDTKALESGQLRLLELELVFQNGEFFSAPMEDDLPEPRAVKDAVEKNGRAIFAAACAPLREGVATNVAANLADAGTSVPYHQFVRPVFDQFTQASTGPVTSLKRSVHLVADSDPQTDLISMPLVAIQRRAGGGYEFDPHYIPPCMNIAASSAMGRHLENFLSLLQAKVQALTSSQREPSKNIIEYRAGDTASFWLLHTASTAVASLSHMAHHRGLHPERLFERMLELAGALMTFAKNFNLSDLPHYEHLDPAPSFEALDAIVRTLLETVVPTQHFVIPLIRIDELFHHGSLNSPKITPRTQLYLGVKSSIATAKLIDAVPKLFKIGSPDDLQTDIGGAYTSGVHIEHAPHVPAEINPRSGMHYFRLENHDVLYARMFKAQTLALFFPAQNFSDLSLELIAINL
jgi:type VI secretion system protein ImpJ